MTPDPSVPPPVVAGWRGVAAEGSPDLAPKVSALLRSRTRGLLALLLHPHRRGLIRVVLAVLGANAAAMAVPYLVGLGIDRGIPAVRAHHPATLWWIGAALLFCALVQSLLLRVFLVGSGRIGQDLLLDLRRRVFAHFQVLSLSFHERYTSGKVISRLTSDLDAINELLDAGLDTLVTAVLSIVSIGVILLVLDLPLGLVVLASFVPLVILSRWFQLRSVVAYRRTRETVALVIVHFTESLRGIRAVQSFRREPRNDQIFDAVSRDYQQATTRSLQLLTVYWPGIRLIGNITIAGVLFYGGLRVIGHQMQVGVLASFLLYLRNFFEPIADVSQFYSTFQGAAAGLEKLAGVLDEEPEVAPPATPAAEPASGWHGRVSFEGVDFSYQPQRPVLSGFDLVIPAGQTVALLGRTGAGKSTVARLLARFYDPTAGAVTIDGVELSRLDDRQRQQAVAMVTQENFLFSGSIADNIAFGRPEADRAQIEAAAVALGVDRFVRHLPDGLDSAVGKNGARLSAGQRQLVALARAFLADPLVLILDEASSSLDAPAERAVQRALRTVLADRTALIIAHRLSTVEVADRVLVLEAGRIIEDGSPEDLLGRTDGRYAALHDAWLDSLV
jgi:ATP-binding cassette subfamily B protein